ncbi:hypothetical protein V7158_15310 [Priestia megaterium]|uniref:hypothetical protein n=1 Tax=Priestia megaterium TaxID=1404 RepID=UPI002FFEB731
MKKAFSEVLDKVVSAEEVSKNESLKQSVLKCIDCGIPVFHRKEHNRHKSFVSAHFVRGHEHIESCRYHAVGQMTILARLSDDDVLSSLDKKNFIFRLTMIHEELGGKKEKGRDQISQGTKVYPTNKKYEGKGKLSSYLGTMKKIIELRNLLADDKKDLTSIVEIDFQGKKIKWKNFYYEPEQYLQAYNYLKKLKYKDRHPICLEGTVNSINYIEKTGNYAVNLNWGTQGNNNEGILQIPSPSIYLNKIELSELSIEIGDNIVTCAKYAVGISKRKGREFLKISANLDHRRQIVIL